MTAGSIAISDKRPFGSGQGTTVGHINETTNFIHSGDHIACRRTDLIK